MIGKTIMSTTPKMITLEQTVSAIGRRIDQRQTLIVFAALAIVLNSVARR